jgi:N,N'-diacetyllegionaminate synthase
MSKPIPKTFVIAEAGVNHNGSHEMALKLVDVAVSCGADAVKFQTFSADKLVSRGVEKAAYQKMATGGGDQYSMLKQLEMSEDMHRMLFARCQQKGIEFLSTAFDEDAVDFLLALGMRRIKVPSGEITNTPFLRFIARKNVPMIVSTGMASLEEVQEAIWAIAEERECLGFSRILSEMLCILHCTSNYPTLPSDVNLRAMLTMAASTGMPVGYSDHTLGLSVSTAAVGLGATVIEKHFTLDKNLPGPDHQASLEPSELAQLIAQIRDVEAALGGAEKAPTQSELPVRALVRRSVTTVRDIKAGETLQAADFSLKRPGTGIPPKYLEGIRGRIAARDLPAGTTLVWNDLVGS